MVAGGDTDRPAEEFLQHRASISEQCGHVELEQQRYSGQIHGIRQHQYQDRPLNRMIGHDRDYQQHQPIVEHRQEQPDRHRNAESPDPVLGAGDDQKRQCGENESQRDAGEQERYESSRLGGGCASMNQERESDRCHEAERKWKA